MDGYGRHDVLEKTFGINNRPFLNALKKRGFYIAKKSTSNYYQTIQSVSSTLNYDYLPNLIEYQEAPLNLHNKAKKIMANSNLRQSLKKLNYKYATFKSAVDFTDLKDADYYWSHNLDFSEFDLALLKYNSVAGCISEDFFKKFIWSAPANYFISISEYKKSDLHIRTQICADPYFSASSSVSLTKTVIQSSQIALLICWMPIIFYVATKAEYLTGYSDQVQFINKQLLNTVDTIIKYSKKPPVIIITGDHGARLNSNFDSINATNHAEAFANLSAFYFPNQDTTGLYQEIYR